MQSLIAPRDTVKDFKDSKIPEVAGAWYALMYMGGPPKLVKYPVFFPDGAEKIAAPAGMTRINAREFYEHGPLIPYGVIRVRRVWAVIIS